MGSTRRPRSSQGMTAHRFLTATFTLAAMAACGTASTGPQDGVATVTISPTGETVLVGASVTLTATLRDVAGNLVSGKSIDWSTSNAAVATVSAGVVTGVTPGGPVTITATSEGKSGTATVMVAPVPIATVEIIPLADTLEVGDTHQFTTVLRSESGTVLNDRAVTWNVDDDAVASVSANGLVTAVSPGVTTVTASSEGIAGSASINVAGCPAIRNPVPTGTLKRVADSFVFTTVDGYTIDYDQFLIRVVTPDSTAKLEFWGNVNDGFMGGYHENLSGKHIKDRLNRRRSILLPSGALLTMTASGGIYGDLVTVSIYENDQSHTFDARTFTLTHSCAGHIPTAIALDEAEADGETATFRMMPNGVAIFTNEYTQNTSATGEPLEKVYQFQQLGETGGYANPNNVRDYYDDPRLGHT